MILLLHRPLLASLARLLVPHVPVDLLHQAGAPAPLGLHQALLDHHGRGRDAVPHLVLRVLHPEAAVPQLRLEAGRAGIDDDGHVPVLAEEAHQVVRVFRVRLLPPAGHGIPVILVGDIEGAPVVPYVQKHAGVRGPVVHRDEPAHPRIHLRTFFPIRVGFVAPHRIDAALRAHPFPQDILAIKNAREGAGVALPNLLRERQIVVHGKVQPV